MTGKSDQAPRRLKLTLRHLEVFLATAGAGSTRGAAQRISRSQSAASGALGELESALGVQLFDRLGKRLVLNDHGHLLLPRAAALLEQAADVEQQFDAGLALPLRIAASLTVGEYILPHYLALWRAGHPAGKVQMHIANSSAVMEAVSSLQADLGFIEGPLTHPRLQVIPWLSDEMTIVARPGHALARGIASHRELENAVWALREPGSGTREAADRWLMEHLGSVQVEFELGSAESLKRVAAEGLAIACLSRRAVEEQLASGSLVELRTRLPKAARRLAMVLHRERQPGQAARTFLALCRSQRDEGAKPRARRR